MREDPFFSDTPRTIMDMEGDSIAFPILYYDFRMISAIFPARTSRIKKLLPHPHFKPIEIYPGTGMMIITAFEYRDTSIGPYNEIALSIPVRFPPQIVLPGFAAISMMLKNRFSVYIHHLPVTTEIARKGGVHFYNYPKFIADITFHDRDDALEVTLKEKDELILRMNSDKIPPERSARMEFHTYSLKNNTVMHTLVEARAARYGMKMTGHRAELDLGSHGIGREIDALDPARTSRGGQHAEGMMAKLFSPDRRWNLDTLSVVSD